MTAAHMYARASSAYWAGQAVESLCAGFRLVSEGEFPKAHVELFVAHHTADYAFRLWSDWMKQPDKEHVKHVRTR